MKAYYGERRGEIFVWDRAVCRVYMNGEVERYPDNWKVFQKVIVHSDYEETVLASELANNWLSRAAIAQYKHVQEYASKDSQRIYAETKHTHD